MPHTESHTRGTPDSSLALETAPAIHDAEETSDRLGEEEEAWYRHAETPEEEERDIRDWLRTRPTTVSVSANPLADEEDAWSRP